MVKPTFIVVVDGVVNCLDVIGAFGGVVANALPAGNTESAAAIARDVAILRLSSLLCESYTQPLRRPTLPKGPQR